MNTLIAAGLLDSPWIVLVFLAVSAIASWISKRRQEKQLREELGEEQPPVGPETPRGEINLDEVMRRLMGEKTPTASPAPPPIPNPPRNQPRVLEIPGQKPARSSWVEKAKEAKRNRPDSSSPPPVISGKPTPLPGQQNVSSVDLQKAYENARRFARNERQREVSRVARSRSSLRGNDYWRNRENARRAFVASLVFGAPKGLEP